MIRLKVRLGLRLASPPSAAGLGNLVSDVVGIHSSLIERFAARIWSAGVRTLSSTAEKHERVTCRACICARHFRRLHPRHGTVAPHGGCGDSPLRALCDIDQLNTGTIRLHEVEDVLTKMGIELNRASLENVMDEIDRDRSRNGFQGFSQLAHRWQQLSATKS